MKKHRQNLIFVIIVLLIDIALLFMPTEFGKISKEKSQNSKRVRAKIIAVDNSELKSMGVVSVGEQVMDIEVLNGKFKGQKLKAVNHLVGKLELDKVFKTDDTALTVLNFDANGKGIIFANVIDHYRINVELALFIIFSSMLILYSGWTGFKSLVSFVSTLIFIWKLLIPGFLKGYDPVLLSLIVIGGLTAIIVYLVAGINKKGHVAFLGAFCGISFTCAMSVVFGRYFKLSGAIKPFSETLLYNGFGDLDLDKLLFSSIFIGAAGAVMDIAMDISVSMWEVKEKKPNISPQELLFSGLRVGRSVTGTMTTTLLLAYSGAYLSLLMVFVGQGVPVINILNLTYVSGEILNTLVGSFGLILVAPFTALVGSVVYVGLPIYSLRYKKTFGFLNK